MVRERRDSPIAYQNHCSQIAQDQISGRRCLETAIHLTRKQTRQIFKLTRQFLKDHSLKHDFTTANMNINIHTVTGKSFKSFVYNVMGARLNCIIMASHCLCQKKIPLKRSYLKGVKLIFDFLTLCARSKKVVI